MKSLLENWRAKAAGVVGGAMLVVGASALESKAQEPQPIASSSASITHEQELQLLRQASDDSREHAEAGFNIGLVLHVGDDLTPAQVPIVVDFYKKLYQSALDQKYPDRGGVVEIFPRPNPGTPASGFHANIGDGIFQVPLAKYGLDPNSDPSIMDPLTAQEVVDDLLNTLPLAKATQAQNEANARTASLTSFSPTGLN